MTKWSPTQVNYYCLLILRKTNSAKTDIGNLLKYFGNLTGAQAELVDTLKSSNSVFNKSLSRINNQLQGLQMNKFCKTKWNYFDGKCYYFSRAEVRILDS